MAKDINSVVLCGHLTRDLGSDQNGKDFQYTQGGMCVARIGLAVNNLKKQQDGTWVDEASFFNVTIFGKTAENLKPYLLKGKQIVVSGHLHQDRWQDQNGQQRSSVSIVADQVQLCGGGQQNGYAQQNQMVQQPTQYQAPQQPYQQAMRPVQQQTFQEDIPWDNGEGIPF